MSSRRKLAAILFADIVGYTRQMSDDEVQGLERRREFEKLARTVAASHSGRVIKMIGDAAMLEFASAVEAVSAALNIQQEMTNLDDRLGTAGQLRVRVGVHVGDVVEEDGDLYGNAVNIAQRVHDMAQPGGICITRDVYVQIRPIMKVRCEPARRKPGKPMPEPVEVYSIIGGASDTITTPRNRLTHLHHNSRLLAAIAALSLITLGHIAAYLLDSARARGIEAALLTLGTDSDGVFLLVGKGLEHTRVLIEVGEGGPVVVVRSFKPDPVTEERWLTEGPITEAAAQLSKTLGAQRETLAVVTENWMRSAPLSVRLEPRSTIPYLAGLLPHISVKDRVHVTAQLATGPDIQAEAPDGAPPATAQPADGPETPFAVAGGRFAPGDSIPIGGRNLGANGLAFLGGMQMTARHWSRDGIVAIVPQSAQPGALRVVVVPEGGGQLDAGIVTIVPKVAQAPTPSAAAPPTPPSWPGRMPPGYNELLAGDVASAANSAAKAVRSDPNNVGALAMDAIARSLSGDLKGAQSSLDRATARSRNAPPPTRALVLLASATVADKNGATPEADSAYGAATEADSRLALPYLLWAQSLRERGGIVRARQVLRTGVRNTVGAAWASRTYRDLAGRLGLGVGPRESVGGPGR